MTNDMAKKVTVLDDYQRVALSMADWSSVASMYEVDVAHEHIADRDALVDRLANSEVVVAMRERTAFPLEVIERLPNLKLLITTGMVNAAIDMAAARRHGVTVCGTRAKGNAMPELTIGVMIALARHFAAEDHAVRTGGWQHTIGVGLAGRCLGLVGLGRIGTPVAKLAQAFDMSVVAWSPHLTTERAATAGVKAVAKEELFSTADFISVHMPLVEATLRLIGPAELRLMKQNAYLINTSRGPIVDEAALVQVLREGRIAGAGLDVYDVEPLPVDHPLRSLPNTLLLPHIGYVTTDAYEVFYTDAVEDIISFSSGNPVRVIN